MTSIEPYFNEGEDNPAFSAREAAAYLSVSKSTFHKLRRNNEFPVCMFMGDLRVRRSDLNQFIRDHLEGGNTGKGRDN